jgi:hypothetical protein
MNIPFNNLYHYIEGCLPQPAMFYLFAPPGSRKITDLRPLHQYAEDQWPTIPKVICHDQETLRWFYYTDDQPHMQQHRDKVDELFYERTGIGRWMFLKDLNIEQATCAYTGISIYDRTVLLHSEINSVDLDLYRDNGFEPAYWFSHAMAARDWYRFAQYDPRLKASTVTRPFLIYSRGFTGSREYRPKFLEMLLEDQLITHCDVSCLHEENGVRLRDLVPENPVWQLNQPERLDVIPVCLAHSDSSADYDPHAINTTALQVVLETHFDGRCLHLTEKSLRPLATGQPFMIMAASGALALLRSYGFETYHGLIDESYDLETNSIERMRLVIQEMRRLSAMDDAQWARWRQQALAIAARNKQRFFSQEFASRVWGECITNLTVALDQAKNTRGQRWLQQRRHIRQYKPENWLQYLRRDREQLKCRALRQRRQGR